MERTVGEVSTDEIPHLIPIATVCAALGCSERTLEGYLEHHKVPMTRLSRSKRGLLSTDYQLLLARCRQPQGSIAAEAA